MNVLSYLNPIRHPGINVWAHELADKRDIIESMMNHQLGKSKKIHARKLDAVTISAQASSAFLNVTHLDGSARATLHYGLVDNDVLVMVMTIGKSRFSKHHDFEIIRMATMLNHVVVGGASKLLNFAKQDITGNLLTYSDRRIGNGNAYRQAGFTHLGQTQPGYFWMKGDKILSRYATQKHKLIKLFGDVDLSKSESKIMHEHGWIKVLDFGHDRWEMKISDDKNCLNLCLGGKSPLISSSTAGNRWVNNGEKDLSVPREAITIYLSSGWKLGRCSNSFVNRTWWIDQNGVQRCGIPDANAKLGRLSGTTNGTKWVIRDGKRLLTKEVLQTDEVKFLVNSNKGKKVVFVDGVRRILKESDIPDNAEVRSLATNSGKVGMRSPDGIKRVVSLEEARALAASGWKIAAKRINIAPEHVRQFAKELETMNKSPMVEPSK